MIILVYTINLPDVVTLGGAYDGGGGGFFSRSKVSRELLQWVVGLE